MATKVYSPSQVQLAYKKVRQLYPSYDHAMMAYKIDDTLAGYQDDGEHGSGIKLHALIEKHHCNNIALFVVRNFGGIHLGPSRFQIISEVAEVAMELLVKEHPDICEGHKPNFTAPTPTLAGNQQDIPINDRLVIIANDNADQSSKN